jgi:serine protease Do
MNEWNREDQQSSRSDGVGRDSIEDWKQYDANSYSFSEPPSGNYQSNQNSFYHNPKPPKKSGRGNGLKIFAIIMCIVVVFVVLVFIGYVVSQENAKKQSSASVSESSIPEVSMEITSTPEEEETQSYDLTGELSSEQIADKVMPSVVGVVVYTKESAQTNSAAAEGSGIIMSSDGYIITNAHVVLPETTSSSTSLTPADKIEIYLNNGEYCQAKLIGADVRTDLAVVKIEKENLVAAEFGDSTALKIGEKAIAIGNPTGRTLSSSFTQGVISGVNREITVGTSGYSMSCIQTDAAINPGNSGGALVNKYGQVIGINSSKIAATEYEGIGFAIPAHEAKPIIDNLIANGYVSGRVRIGIVFQSIPQALAELRGTPAGLRVVQVDESTDAYAKGVQPGDIITKIDGQDVVTLQDVSAILNEKKPGDTVTMTIYRAKNTNASTLNVEVELQEDTTGKIVQ